MLSKENFWQISLTESTMNLKIEDSPSKRCPWKKLDVPFLFRHFIEL